MEKLIQCDFNIGDKVRITTIDEDFMPDYEFYTIEGMGVIFRTREWEPEFRFRCKSLKDGQEVTVGLDSLHKFK